MSVRILYNNCTSCGSCYTYCPNDIIGWNDEKNIPYIAYPEECSHCGVCALECKFDAINHIIPLACYVDINPFMPPLKQPQEFDWKKYSLKT